MVEQTKVLLQDNGVDGIHFYTMKTPLLTNALTVCILRKGDKIEARGVSICSLMDAFNITKGKHKSLGRALKALKRKQNFYKINGSGRNDEFVQREMKIKTEEADRNFRLTVAPELKAIDPETKVKIHVGTNAKFIKKYIFELPLSYPVQVANRQFRYKSHYRPTAVGDIEPVILDRVENTEASKSF